MRGLIARFAGVLAFLVVFTFLIIHLVPGDPVRRLAGVQATPQDIARLRSELNLDEPLPSQFVSYVTGLIRLDFGDSLVSERPVGEIILSRLPESAKLAGVAALVVFFGGIATGFLLAAATRDGRRPRLEAAFTGVSSALVSIPVFLTGALVLVVFALWLEWLPAGGARGWTSLVLPVLALSAGGVANMARLVRVEVLNILKQDYIRTAESKRLARPVLYARHVLPNVLPVALTVGGLTLSGLVAGAVIIEAVFAWPGLGAQMVNAIQIRDYPVIQGLAFVLGVMVLSINLVVDAMIRILSHKAEL